MLRGFAAVLCLLTGLSAARGAGPVTAPLAQADRLEVTPGPEPTVRPLPFFYDLYTFRGAGGTTAVVASFAVAAGKLERENVARGVRYRFDVSLVLADTALRSVNRTDDSVYVGLSRPLSDDHLLYTSIEVQAPPSASTLQRVIMIDATRPGIGQLYTSHFPVPDYSGSELMLSDIALGQPEADGGWTRGDVTLALLPTAQFPASAFDVYYEIYNLPAGNRYVTEISVDRVSDAGGPGHRLVRLGFAGESTASPDAALAELRRVETSLERGRYLITVTITDDVTRQTASRSRIFEVHSSKRGATMVPAIPRVPRPR